MGKKAKDNSEDKKKEIKDEIRIREETIGEEIRRHILRQQESIREDKIKNNDDKKTELEEIIEKEVPKEDEIKAYMPQQEKGLDYEYIFSYLGSGVRKTMGDEYRELTSADTSIAWTNERGDRDIMDIKERESYAIKQASNMLLGTSMSHISHEEKIRFNAYMNDPSNKIIFLISYAMLGMDYKTPSPKTNNTNMTDEQIKEKSMKNDIAISSRFDTKGNTAKDYIK